MRFYKKIKNYLNNLINVKHTYYSNSSNIRMVFATNIRIPKKNTIRPTLLKTNRIRVVCNPLTNSGFTVYRYPSIKLNSNYVIVIV